MELSDLANALLEHDVLAARQWVADAAREQVDFSTMPRPDLDPTGMALAAGLAELLSSRAGQPPPPWAAEVEAAPQPVFLVHEALRLPRLRRLCQEEGPEPLRRRALYAPPEFLTFA